MYLIWWEDKIQPEKFKHENFLDNYTPRVEWKFDIYNNIDKEPIIRIKTHTNKQVKL